MERKSYLAVFFASNNQGYSTTAAGLEAVELAPVSFQPKHSEASASVSSFPHWILYAFRTGYRAQGRSRLTHSLGPFDWVISLTVCPY